MNRKVTKQVVIKAINNLLTDCNTNKEMAIASENWAMVAEQDAFMSGVQQALAVVELLDEC